MRMLALSVVMMAVAAPGVRAQESAAPSRPVIVTSGEGVVKRAPDRAYVTIAAETRAATATDAQNRNTEAMTAVIARIKAMDIAADAIQTSGYLLQPEYDYSAGKQTFRDYLARNQVQVRIDALPRLGEVLTAVVGTGATTISGIRFDVKSREADEREALRLAVRDARARADAAAAGAGVQIDRIVRIDEERSFAATPRPMAMMGGVAGGRIAETVVPIEAGESEIRARVTLTASIR